jgi:diguanylate cyclase (GGDEF)-like protein/PAS domain S-box-containing protein
MARAQLRPDLSLSASRLVAAVCGLAALFAGGRIIISIAAPDVLDAWRLTVGMTLMAAAVGSCLLRAIQIRRDRWAWTAIGAGIVSFVVGSVVARVYGAADAAPAAAHIGWLGFYACLYGGLVVMARSALRPFPWSHLLDAVAATLVGVGALVALVAAVGPGSYRPVEAALGVAYPALDLLLAGLVLWISNAGEVPHRRDWHWLLVALIVLGLADALLFVMAVLDALSFGALYTVFYPLAIAVLGFAAWAPSPPQIALRPRSIASLRIPLGTGAVALAVIGYGAAGLVAPISLVLAVVGLVLVCVRGAYAYRELTQLQLARRFERGFQDAGIGMAFVDPQGRWVRVNAALAAVMGTTPEQLHGAAVTASFDPPSARVVSVVQAQLRGGRPRVDPTPLTVVRRDGTLRHVLVAGDVVTEEDGRQLFLQIHDLTTERRAERFAEVLVDLSRRALSEVDVDHFIAELTESVAHALGADLVAAVIVGDGGSRVIAPPLALTAEQREGLAAADDPICASLERRDSVHWHDLLDDDGPTVDALISAGLESAMILPLAPAVGPPAALVVGRRVARSAEPADEARFLRSVANLVTVALERGRREERSRHHALHDPLTGLANRTLLGAHVDHALKAVSRESEVVGALLLDLDRFKDVNDTLGHEAGDRLLLAVAERLTEASRASDLVARLGGDEFVVVTRAASLEELEAMAQRLLGTLAAPFHLEDADQYVGASIGIAVAADGDATAEVLLRDADVAMYRAKSAGGGSHAVFDADLRAELLVRVHTERALRHAVDRGQLRLVLQPQIPLAGNGPVSFEALVRWERPGIGLVAPGEFVHVAEDTGLIVPVGTWVLRESLRWMANTAASVGVVPTVSVNVSARQLTSALPDIVASALRDTNVPPQSLCLELTESMLIDQPSAAPVIARLRGLGVRLSLDDFGTGWSSLASLRRHPVDELKLDRSMIESLGKDAASTAVTRAAVDMARALGISVVAEGIERQEQLAAVINLGCEIGQGFLFARPLSPHDAADFLRDESWRATVLGAATDATAA